MDNLAKLLCDEILSLNSIRDNNFSNIKSKLLIYKCTKKMKKAIKKNSYTPRDLYSFLIFIKEADKLKLIPKNIENSTVDYRVDSSNDISEISTGILSVKTDPMHIIYKTIVYVDRADIEIYCSITEDKSKQIDYKTICNTTKSFSITMHEIFKPEGKSTNFKNAEDIVGHNSYDILNNVFKVYILAISGSIESRYIR